MLALDRWADCREAMESHPQPGPFMNTCYVVRSSCPARLFSFGLLDGLPVRLRRPYVREAPASFSLERLATAFMNSPGWQLRKNSVGTR
jgi:hypothetical protein